MTRPEAVERFTELYDEHYRHVFGYAVSRVGRQLAEEVTSETFMVAWRRLSEVPAQPLPWLLGVARNVARDSYRAQARRASLEAELAAWTTTGDVTSDDVADAVVERAAVLRALAGLPEADREVLTLVAWHGLTPQQAAGVVGCSTAAFFVRLHRARRRLERVVRQETQETAGDAPEPAAEMRAAAPLALPGEELSP